MKIIPYSKFVSKKVLIYDLVSVSAVKYHLDRY